MYQPAPYPQNAASQTQAAGQHAAFFRRVYAFMALGLTATAVTAMLVASSEEAVRFIVLNRPVFYGLLIAELAMVWGFTALVNRISTVAAGAMFFTYAIMNGLTLSVIFLVYTGESLASTFFITAGSFGALSAYGYATKRDLTGVGSFAMMGLFGLIIASVVNLFLQSTMIYWLTTFMGVIVFTALTAYDTQKIKQLNQEGEAGEKGAIFGALILYLDFINLFLFLLRLLGRRK
ncbi:MAG: Bax inhibitor-1/YccA family protein [Byssovorax sp.]